MTRAAENAEEETSASVANASTDVFVTLASEAPTVKVDERELVVPSTFVTDLRDVVESELWSTTYTEGQCQEEIRRVLQTAVSNASLLRALAFRCRFDDVQSSDVTSRSLTRMLKTRIRRLYSPAVARPALQFAETDVTRLLNDLVREIDIEACVAAASTTTRTGCTSEGVCPPRQTRVAATLCPNGYYDITCAHSLDDKQAAHAKKHFRKMDELPDRFLLSLAHLLTDKQPHLQLLSSSQRRTLQAQVKQVQERNQAAAREAEMKMWKSPPVQIPYVNIYVIAGLSALLVVGLLVGLMVWNGSRHTAATEKAPSVPEGRSPSSSLPETTMPSQETKREEPASSQ